MRYKTPQNPILFADFETTKDRLKPEVFMFQISGEELERWIKPVKEKWHMKREKGMIAFYGHNLSNFMELLSLIPNSPVIFFNNLYRFDGHFILPYLVNTLKYTQIHDFKFTEFKTLERVEKLMTLYKRKARGNEKKLKALVKKHWKNLHEKEFSSLIDDKRGIFSIKVGRKGPRESLYTNEKSHTIEFRCMLRQFMTPVEKMGEAIGGDWNKKKLDYSKYTSPFKLLSDLEKDKDLMEYAIQDVILIRKYFYLMLKDNNYSFYDLAITAPGTSYRQLGISVAKKFASDYGYFPRKTKKSGFIRYHRGAKDKIGVTTGELARIIMSHIFPTKFLDTLDSKTGKAVWYSSKEGYNGGLGYVNEDYRGKLTPNCSHLDINSSYSRAMASGYHAPYGEPVPKEEGTFHEYKVVILRDIRNDKGIPFVTPRELINTASSGAKKQYPRTLLAGESLLLTSILMSDFIKYYNVKQGDIKTSVIHSFRSRPIKDFFGDYVKENYKKKQYPRTPFQKVGAKLKLNSPYGKFGSKIDREMTYISANGDWDKYPTTARSYYIPMARTITDIARKFIVDAVGEMGHNVLYCDTDSLIIKDFIPKDYPNIKLENDTNKGDLGLWGYEKDITPAKALIRNKMVLIRRSKQYMWYGDNFEVLKAVFASLHIKEEHHKFLSPKNFITGLERDKCIIHINMTQKVMTKSGIYLDDDFYKVITPAWKYPPHREQIVKSERDYLELIKSN